MRFDISVLHKRNFWFQSHDGEYILEVMFIDVIKTKRKSTSQVVAATYEMLNPCRICYDNRLVHLFIVAYPNPLVNLSSKKY